MAFRTSLSIGQFINPSSHNFRGPFCVHDVRQSLVMRYLEQVINTVASLPEGVPPSLLLVTARLSLDFETTTIR